MAARTRMCAFCGLVAGLPAGGPEEVHEQRVGRELALLAPLLYRRPESALNRQLAAEPRRAAVPAVWIEDSWPAIPAWRARAYAWGRAARSTSTSASVDGWPSVNRCAPRAVSSSRPIASRTWEGRGTPAVQAEPVEDSTPARSRRKSSESPSQPGKVK